jgi:VanZ family protein
MFLSGMLARGRTRVKADAFLSAVRVVPWLAAAVWMGGIFYLSHQSAPLGATVSELESIVAHVGLYAGLALLLRWALVGAARSRGRAVAWAAAAFALAVLYGVSDEIHQAFVPGRTASVVDIAFDAAGAGLGVGLALLATALLNARPMRP